MALPKAVQKQVDEANRIAEELSQKPSVEASPDTSNLVLEAVTAPDNTSAENAGEPAPAPAPAPAPDGWEQKYKVLQGKYNAEVPRLQRQLNDMNSRTEYLTSQLTATQTMLASLSQRQDAAHAGNGSAPAATSKLVKDEEVQQFGEDLTDFIRRVAQDTVLPQVEGKLRPVQQQVEQVRNVASHVAQRSAQTDQERVLATLDKEVSGWRNQNKDAAFLNWLDEVDPYSGQVRGDLLKRAYESNDTPRVVAFFKGYRNENAVVSQPARNAPAPAEAQAGSQKGLDEFVSPGTPKAGTTGAPNDLAGKRIWTQPEIKKFYDDCTNGKYRTNAKRRDEIERDIFSAQLEGRIR